MAWYDHIWPNYGRYGMIWTIYDLCSRYTLDTIMTITIMSPIHICHWDVLPEPSSPNQVMSTRVPVAHPQHPVLCSYLYLSVYLISCFIALWGYMQVQTKTKKGTSTRIIGDQMRSMYHNGQLLSCPANMLRHEPHLVLNGNSLGPTCPQSSS